MCLLYKEILNCKRNYSHCEITLCDFVSNTYLETLIDFYAC